MNLVKFILFGAIISIVFGEFGQYPFGSSFGVNLPDILLGLTVMFFIIWKVISKTRIVIPKAGYWLIIFECVALISLLVSLLWVPFPEVAKSSLYLVRLVIYSSVFLITYNLRKDNLLDFDKISSVLISTGILLTVLGYAQLIFFPDLNRLVIYGFDPHIYRMASTFLDPNFLGTFICLTGGLLLISYLKRRNKITILGLITLLVALILTYSRSAYLMATVFLLILIYSFWQKFRSAAKIKGAVLFLIVVGLTLLVTPRLYERVSGGLMIDETASARLISWETGWDVFKTSPILGVGFNNIRYAKERLNLIQIFTTDGGHSGSGTDSSFLLVLATTGVIGLFFYLSFWRVALTNTDLDNNFSKTILLALFASLLVNTQFNNTLFYPAVMIWYFSILGTVVKD